MNQVKLGGNKELTGPVKEVARPKQAYKSEKPRKAAKHNGVFLSKIQPLRAVF